MTHCQAGPNGTKCHTCVLWDEMQEQGGECPDPLTIPSPLVARLIDAKFLPDHPLLEKIRQMVRETAEANLAEAKENTEYDSAKSAIAKLERENARLRTAVDALRNVLGRTIETRIDPKTGKPYHYLNEERAKALALAGEVMK